MTTHHDDPYRDDPRRVAHDEDRAEQDAEDRAWFEEQDMDRRVWNEVYP